MSEPDNLPAVQQRVAPELDQWARLGRWLAAAESERKDAESLGAAAALRFYLAQQLGLAPLAASELSMVKGRLVVGAKLVRALARNRGFKVKPLEVAGVDAAESCTAVLYDENDNEVGRVTYTLEQARTAGLVKDGSGYLKNPERMLWARASKRVVDDFAPDVSLGLLSEEEAEEILLQDRPQPRPEPPAEPDVVEGEVVAEDDEPPPDEEPPAEGVGPMPVEERQVEQILTLAREELAAFPPPPEYGDWEAYATAKALEWYKVESFRALSMKDAQELIVAMANRLKALKQAAAQDAADAAARAKTDDEGLDQSDDVPF